MTIEFPIPHRSSGSVPTSAPARRGRGLLGMVLVAGLAASGAAQRPDSSAAPAPRIIGVFDEITGQPLSGVQVSDAFSGTTAVTTVSGTVRLDFLSFRGMAALVQLRKLGYEAKEIVVSRGDTTPITEVMEPVAALAPVVTTERYRIDRDAGRWDGFAQRCQAKGVTCVGTDALERQPTANLGDLLLHADGMTIGACGGGKGRNEQCGRVTMRSSVIPPSYCEPTFFIDGFPWNTHIGPAADMVPNSPPQAPYTPANVKAIEVYPTGRPRPLRFEGNPLCGAIVIWTK